jgi:hypothetical protein
VATWTRGRATVEDTVTSPRRITSRALRDSFFEDIQSLTFGLVRRRESSLYVGPLELLRFGPAKVSRTSVELPIEGGLLVGAPGGYLRLEAAKGRMTALVEGYRPRLPRAIYALTQLPFHHTIMRLFLLRERGRLPEPGVPAPPTKRLVAGAIDTGLCAMVALMAGKRRRLPALLGITAGYHIACWSLSGRTIGGLVTKQRVVAVDGSRLSVGQAVIRLLALPLAAVRTRAVHDEIAATEVVAD